MRSPLPTPEPVDRHPGAGLRRLAGPPDPDPARPVDGLPPEPEPTEPEIFEVAEVQPELIGGLEGLQGRVEYPEFARRAGIEGQVVVQFVVDERGNVVDPVALRSPNDLLSGAAPEALPVTFRLR